MGTLVNHTVANLQGGVTQQFDELASEVQVREMLNCLPSTSRGVLRRNPIEEAISLNDNFANRDYFIYTYDRGTSGEQYIVFIGNGDWKVFNSNTKSLISHGTSTYLNIPFGVSAKEAFSLITIGDFTFVVNKYVKISLSGITEGTINSHKATGIYWIKKTSENTVASKLNSYATGYLIEGYNYVVNTKLSQGIRDTRPTLTADQIDRLTGDKIISHLVSQLGTGYVASSAILYKKNMAISDSWSWGDSNGSQASFGFKGIVQRADQLPDSLPTALQGTIVNVTQNTRDTLDDYWLEYKDTWTESKKPGMVNTLGSSTMPHVLVRSSGGTFNFVEYTESALSGIGQINPDIPYGWKGRTVGDEVSCKAPSFVDNYITQVFFHKGRLGFISRDNIILSENGDYGNFYNTTVRNLLDTDPIDITIATSDVSYINYVIATSNSLILFSNKTQFTLTSGNDPLTATTAVINVLSKYTNTSKVAPIALGGNVLFVGESGGYSQVYLMNKDTALNVSKHIPTYIPKNIKLVVGDNVLGHIFMWSPDYKREIFVYSQNLESSNDILSAFHKWTFNADVIGFNIINNKLIVSLQDEASNAIYTGDISLDIPGDFTVVNYSDKVNGTYYTYESSLEFTKWFIKDGNGNGSKNGRLQIRTVEYTLDKRSNFSSYIVTNDGTVSTATGEWNDSATWSDTTLWSDGVLFYTLVLDNNPKIQVMSNSNDTLIAFKNDRANLTKGFEISTINFEGYLHQRSQRI